MASMVKEKRRGKKKAKEKLPTLKVDVSLSSKDVAQEEGSGQKHVYENEEVESGKCVEQAKIVDLTPKTDLGVDNVNKAMEQSTESKEKTPDNKEQANIIEDVPPKVDLEVENVIKAVVQCSVSKEEIPENEEQANNVEDLSPKSDLEVEDPNNAMGQCSVSKEKTPENEEQSNKVEDLLPKIDRQVEDPIKDMQQCSVSKEDTPKNEEQANIIKVIRPNIDLEVENPNNATEQCTVQANCTENISHDIAQQSSTEIDYKELNDKLKRIAIPESSSNIDEKWLENPESYLQPKSNELAKESVGSVVVSVESVVPSAPMCMEQIEPGAPPEEELLQDELRNKKLKAGMSLDEAIRVYGGKEIAEVKEISEREEADVVAGPDCPPDHPLNDLLSTFRTSIRAVERERARLAAEFADEEKIRSRLWKVEKQSIHITEQCKCTLKVDMKATYERAELLKEKIPAAKLRLHALLNEVQESYCIHQHAAMLAHCQIEDLISETIQVNKNNIRENLSLILRALRASDGAPDVLPAALQRWAEILAGALIDERDLKQLLFVMHHLFRQTRSVRWAARVIHTRVTDSVTAARTLAVLDILLSKLLLEAATECDEDTEGWEEMDVRGGGGAVSTGALRERDLLALLRALPLQHLVAKIVLFEHSDIRQATEYEWGDASGGRGLLKSCCGVRALLAVLRRAQRHRAYTRLHAAARHTARAALSALQALHRSPRAPYLEELDETITAELHAAFADGFVLFGTEDLDKLPTMLLTDDVAQEYCLNLIVGLHEKSRRMLDCLSIEMPVLPCGTRLRMITRAAADRVHDHGLARIVLDFLLQTGIVRKSTECKSGCEPAARECIPQLLSAHPYLRVLALHTVAELAQVETLEPSTIAVLQVNKWRPDAQEMQAVLSDWSQRCPTLLQQLLLQLDYTPHSGLDLPVQLHLGRWLCTYSCTGASQLEHAWRVLLKLRTHRACWSAPCVAPPPDPEPTDLFSMAYAVLSSDWGHSLPMICKEGVNAIFTLCATRPREAVHCLAAVMLVMPQSPESVSLTPAFAELFTILLNCGPNLVQRALGRGGASGAELLLRLVLNQVDMKQPYIFPTWLHALWQVPAALSILDIAALAVRDWFTMDSYAYTIARMENFNEYLNNAVRFAITSPLLCECLLRVARLQEFSVPIYHSLLTALCRQRQAMQRIHVDKALQNLGTETIAEELMIYRCANAALVAPFQHPSHLTLWRLFFHIYLERPRDIDPRDPAWMACGPLFFSGIIKSRALSQIKKRLLETATFHHNEEATYKTEPESIPPRNRVIRSASIVNDYESLFPPLTITDLTDESLSDYEDSDSEGESSKNFAIDESTEEAINVEKKRNDLLASYHAGAERMMRDFVRWLDEGEKVQALPACADIPRYIVPQALDEAWNQTLSRCRPPPNPDLDTFIRPEPTPPFNNNIPKTPLQTAIDSILSIKCRSPISESYRSLRTIRPRVDVLNNRAFGDIQKVLTRVTELLTDLEKYAEEWDKEVTRIKSQDNKLWEFVSSLRVPRPLPPVKKQCANKCQPIVFYLNTHEWCISAGAERGVRECRAASLAGIQRLAMPRFQIVRVAAGLHNIARRIRTAADAGKVLELAWRCAGTCKCCHAAQSAILLLFETLVEKWIRKHKVLCNQLLQRSCESNTSPLQHILCGSLVSPRSMDYADWPDIYITLLECSLPPHIVFSFLSRFDVKAWSKHINNQQRHIVLSAILSAVIGRADIDGSPDFVLQELLGVHTTLILSSRLIMWMVMECIRYSVLGILSPLYWKHIIVATDRYAKECTLEELGTILSSMGGMWCTAERDDCDRHATYALITTEVIQIIVREYEAAAVGLTYAPERVATGVWTVMVAGFSPWVHPGHILPDPSNSPVYADTLKRFADCIVQLMKGCPGSEVSVLQFAYSSTIAQYEAGQLAEPVPHRHLTAWLEQMTPLPWNDYQWFTASYVQTLLKVVNINKEELSKWAYDRITATKVPTLMDGCDVDQKDIHLANCLKAFAGSQYVTDLEFISTLAQLPWWKVKEEGLKEGMIIFFREHFSTTIPYYDKPHATLLLNAAELNSATEISERAHSKRKQLISTWTRLYKQPSLTANHTAGYTKFMLERITFMAPYAKTEDEKVDLLRELGVLLESAGADVIGVVLEVWLSWLLHVPLYILGPVVSASSELSVTPHTAIVADNALRLYLLLADNHWYMVKGLWARHRQSPCQFLELGALYAAYASLIIKRELPVKLQFMITKLQALIDSNTIDYEKNEGIVAVWICYLLRLINECDDEINHVNKFREAGERENVPCTCDNRNRDLSSIYTDQASKERFLQYDKYVNLPIKKVKYDRFGSDMDERDRTRQAILSVLTCWGQHQRRSLLKVVTLQADTERPTARHRALVRLVDCILKPCPETAQAYQDAITSLSGNYSDVITFGLEPTGKKLITLATRLLPSVPDRYFLYELRYFPTP